MQAILSFFDSISANKVNIGAPQQHSVAYLEGYETRGLSVYSKSQNNLVVINFTVQRINGANLENLYQQVAVIPIGFRPAGWTHTGGYSRTDANNASGAAIGAQGELYIAPAINSPYAAATFVYYAAQ